MNKLDELTKFARSTRLRAYWARDSKRVLQSELALRRISEGRLDDAIRILYNVVLPNAVWYRAGVLEDIVLL